MLHVPALRRDDRMFVIVYSDFLFEHRRKVSGPFASATKAQEYADAIYADDATVFELKDPIPMKPKEDRCS